MILKTGKLLAVVATSLAFINPSSATSCQAVADLDTLKSKTVGTDKNLRIGPGGFFADAADGGCYVLSVNQAGFDETYPDLASTYSDILSRDTTTPASKRVGSELEARALPGCGQACDPNDGCLSPCACRFQDTLCTPDFCIDIYRCTG
ncbi:hypothetical protein BDY19DRAFT_939810 [Irpex rosettiformis]|uniref:Uncharacterized protein n=1 Tax=Irpex rosettiformis TaxID=378272 RepID=A0ACB8U881_9APHY|nr:hypothetical protein BDY19DRAFT_939810 [Irpex rosettiformis]